MTSSPPRRSTSRAEREQSSLAEHDQRRQRRAGHRRGDDQVDPPRPPQPPRRHDHDRGADALMPGDPAQHRARAGPARRPDHAGAYVLASLADRRHAARRHRAVPRRRARRCCSPPTSPSAGSHPTPTALLLPLAGLLNGIGYVFIARLDEAEADPQPLAGLQAWTAVGIAAFVVTLIVVRGPRSRALPLHPRPRRCRAAAAPARARHRPDHQRRRIWVAWPPPASSRARSPRSCWRSSSRRTSSKSASCSREHPPARADPPARPQAPRPPAARVGLLARRHDRREGPRLLAAVLRPVRRDAVGRHRAGRLPRSIGALLFARARSFASQRSATSRTGWTSGSTRGRTPGTASRSSSLFALAGAASPAPGSASAARTASPCRDRLHLRRHR